VGAEIVEDHDVAWLQRRRKELFDIGVEGLPVDGSVKQAGRVDAVLRKAARQVAVFHLPCGTLSTRRCTQPRRRVVLVLVQVSSMKMRRVQNRAPMDPDRALCEFGPRPRVLKGPE
jgi:hypothetical protein